MTTLVPIGNCMGAPAYFKDLFYDILQVNSIDEAYQVIHPDCVIMYGGGEDISPALYNEPHNPKTYAPKTPSKRDTLEKGIFEIGEERGAKHYGICRGAQLLAALSGGKLYQHIDNHQSSHKAEIPSSALKSNIRQYGTYREMMELAEKPVFNVTSVHHQAVDITSLAEKFNVIPMLENPCLSKYYERGDFRLEAKDVGVDNEAYFIPELKVFGVQGHPEFDSRGSDFVNFCKLMMLMLTRT